MSKQTTFDKVEILGVEIDVLTLADATEYICTMAAEQSREAAYVIKPYVEFLSSVSGKPDIADLLNGAELAITDGVAIVWAAHYLYAGPRTAVRFWRTLAQILIAPAKLTWPIPERAAGTNFTWPLLHAAADRHLRVFLAGKNTPAAIESVVAAVQHAIPEITIVGFTSGHDPRSNYGHVSPEWLERTATHIAETKPDLILVGMGFPLQEEVCAYLASHAPHGVFIGEGGTFDYESFGGNRPKAPQAVQRIGLEWLWRLVEEPKRIVRQLAIPKFIYLIWQSRR